MSDMAACQKEQINIIKLKIREEHINLTGNILILSDRLIEVASELMNIIKQITNADALGVISCSDDVIEYQQFQIDYLIIVGYLDNEKNYLIISELRYHNKHLKTVKWAALDNLITDYCRKYNIFFKFDRWESVNNFFHYLVDIKDDNDLRNTA